MNNVTWDETLLAFLPLIIVLGCAIWVKVSRWRDGRLNKLQYSLIFFLVMIIVASGLYSYLMSDKGLTPEGFRNPIVYQDGDPHFELNQK